MAGDLREPPPNSPAVRIYKEHLERAAFLEMGDSDDVQRALVHAVLAVATRPDPEPTRLEPAELIGGPSQPGPIGSWGWAVLESYEALLGPVANVGGLFDTHAEAEDARASWAAVSTGHHFTVVQLVEPGPDGGRR